MNAHYSMFLPSIRKEQNKDNIINPTSSNPYVMSIEEYFNPRLHPGKDVGHLRQMTSRTQKFSATVALSDEFPLSLQDQVLPIINLMVSCWVYLYASGVTHIKFYRRLPFFCMLL